MKRLILTICLCVLFTAGTALADWDEDDDYKMHYPQLPDPYGWDVKATTIWNPDYNPDEPDGVDPYLQHKVVADDWECTESGPVSDVHFWGSWKRDIVAPIDSIHLSIHEDIPADESSTGYSMPGALLWERDITDFTIREGFTGMQGWYNPNTGEYNPYDHFTYHQINIVDIPDPFIQEGTPTDPVVYWLDIQVDVPYLLPADGTTGDLDPNQPEWGWKTSQYHWNDDAVWSDSGEGPWYELYDPYYYESLDMAFVITPEPATIVLLGFGSLALLRKKRRA